MKLRLSKRAFIVSLALQSAPSRFTSSSAIELQHELVVELALLKGLASVLASQRRAPVRTQWSAVQGPAAQMSPKNSCKKVGKLST